METKDIKLAILNLAGELSQELSDYFSERGIKVVDPKTSSDVLPWTHIVTKDNVDFAEIENTYKTTENDIKIISLSAVSEIESFILSNGKLILDEMWLKGPMGQFILDKFFQEYAGITLGDNYPKLKEKGSFNVVNPFSTGDFLDRMVYEAFNENFSGLAIKTFFDHFLMYLTGLKNKGKTGLPIEVTYGTFDDIFAVQLHFYANDLRLDDITSCLSSTITKKAEEYLINISIQSTDFFDFTYLSEVQKVVVTGLWTNDERIKMENKGLVFSNLSSAATLSSYPAEGVTSNLLENEEVGDMSPKVNLPEKIVGEETAENLAEKLASNFSMDQITEILNGDTPEDEDKIVLGSTDEMEELVSLIKGSIDEEEEQVFKISGEKLDVDNFVFKVSSGISDKAKEKGVFSYKSLGEKLPDKIKKGLFDFAVKIGKDANDLSQEDIDTFKQKEIPSLIRDESVIGDNNQLRKDIKANLEASLKNAGLSHLNADDEMKVKSLLKDVLKSSLEDNFRISANKGISDQDKNIMVKSLSASLEDEDKIRTLIKDNTQGKQAPGPTLNGKSDVEKELQSQLNTALSDVEVYKGKMKTMLSVIKVLKDSRNQMAQIQAKAQKAAEQAEASKVSLTESDEKLRKHFQEKLAKQENLNELEQKKLKGLLDREADVLKEAREAERNSRKIQIESTQKQVIFNQELEKIQRQLKTKDLLIDKSKEMLQKTIEAKDNQMLHLQQRIDQQAQASAAPSQSMVTAMKELEKQNQNMTRMVEMYKNKVTTLSTRIQTNKHEDDSKEEVRKLQMLNNQFKNQVDAAKKEVAKFQEKVNYDAGQISGLRQEKTKLEQQVKKLTQEKKKEELTPKVNVHEEELKKAQGHIPALDIQLKDSKEKLKETEGKLVEALKALQKQAGPDNTDKKVQHMEASIKKLTQDLIDARNQSGEMKKETNKLRQEKTALQNQLDKIKKDSEKAAKTAPPKPGTGGKAA